MAGSKLVQEALDAQAEREEMRDDEMAALREALGESIHALTAAIKELSQRVETCEGIIYTVANQQTAAILGEVGPEAEKPEVKGATKRAFRRGL